MILVLYMLLPSHHQIMFNVSAGLVLTDFVCVFFLDLFFVFQSVDHLTFSYKFGSFLKIEEFVEFRERLNNSLHYALVTVERMLFELLASEDFRDTVKVSASVGENDLCLLRLGGHFG